MKIALWIVQVLLAFAFLGAGSMKLLTPYEELASQMAWATHVPSFLPKLIGLAEVLGAIGLIVPAATRIKPGLTPLAAAGLALTMALGVITHVLLGEFGMIGGALGLGALSLFVAWGRTKKAPITAR